MSPEPAQVPRRRFLALCGQGALALIGLIVIGFGVDYYFPSLRRRFTKSKAPYVALCAVDTLPSGKWKLVALPTPKNDGKKPAIPGHSVWVRRDGDGPDAIRVLSPICPHAGCEIAWKAERTAFVCPCHGGTFDVDGQYKSGPPPRSMDPLDFRVEDGQLLVQWLEFENGSSSRVRTEAS
jgi:menaquinol-cytochrome c reductase iron-sulfur subunit